MTRLVFITEVERKIYPRVPNSLEPPVKKENCYLGRFAESLGWVTNDPTRIHRIEVETSLESLEHWGASLA
jgi:hypothetical protein